MGRQSYGFSVRTQRLCFGIVAKRDFFPVFAVCPSRFSAEILQPYFNLLTSIIDTYQVT